MPGRDTLIADLLDRTGFVLASAAQGMGQADHLPLEMLLADPPSVLFVAGDMRSQENRSLVHPVLGRTMGELWAAFDRGAHPLHPVPLEPGGPDAGGAVFGRGE